MTEFNAKFNKLEKQLGELQDKITILDGDDSDENSMTNNLMDFEDDADEDTGFLAGDSEIGRSGRNITNSLKKSYATSDIARGAMVKLRG